MNEENKVGRPTKYNPQYILMVEDYLKRNQDEEEVVRLPTISGFASEIGFPEKTLYAWANNEPEFRKALDKIKEEQKKRLLNKGLSGDYNSTIAKLILSANHGMREGKDITTDGEKISGNTIEIID